MSKPKERSIVESPLFAVKVCSRNKKYLEFLEEAIRKERGFDNVLDVQNSDIINNAFEIAYWVKKNKINIKR